MAHFVPSQSNSTRYAPHQAGPRAVLWGKNAVALLTPFSEVGDKPTGPDELSAGTSCSAHFLLAEQRDL